MQKTLNGDRKLAIAGSYQNRKKATGVTDKAPSTMPALRVMIAPWGKGYAQVTKIFTPSKQCIYTHIYIYVNERARLYANARNPRIHTFCHLLLRLFQTMNTSSSDMSDNIEAKSSPSYGAGPITAEHHEDIPFEKSVESLPIESVSYGPNDVRGLLSSPYVLSAAFLASLGGFSFGYDQGVISIINVMDQFHDVFPRAKTAFGTGFMTGMLLLGAFLGCLFMPYLADKFSRKKALTFVVIIFDIGAIIQTSAQNYGMLVAGRFIGGIGVGTLAMVCDEESSPCSC